MSKAGVRDRSRMRGGVPRLRPKEDASRGRRGPAVRSDGRRQVLLDGGARGCATMRRRARDGKSRRQCNRETHRNLHGRRDRPTPRSGGRRAGLGFEMLLLGRGLELRGRLGLDGGPIAAVHGVEAGDVARSIRHGGRRRRKPRAEQRRDEGEQGQGAPKRSARSHATRNLLHRSLDPRGCHGTNRRSIYAVRCKWQGPKSKAPADGAGAYGSLRYRSSTPSASPARGPA